MICFENNEFDIYLFQIFRWMMRSFCLVRTLVIELFDFEVNISEFDLQAVLLLLDVQVEPQQSLEVRDIHLELREEISNSDFNLQNLVDVTIEKDVVVAVINIEDLVEVEAKDNRIYTTY